MSEWRECKLSDVALKFAMGPFGSNIKAENFTDKGVPVIRGKNLNFFRFVDGEFVYITEEKAETIKSSSCFPGDLVITHRGTLGQVCLIPDGKFDRYIISQSGMKVTPNPELLDGRFLLYYFKSDIGQNELLQHESQVGVPSISNPLTSLKSVALRLPPIQEQKSIASVLSSLDDKIDLLHRQNKTLEAMAETLFRQWFVEGAGDWEVVRLGDIADVGWGDTNTTKSSYVEAGYLAYSATGPDGFMDHYDFDKAGIVVSAIGANCGKIWFANGKWSCIKNTIRIFSNDSLVSEEYLYFLLNKPDGWPIRGSAQPFISQTDARNIDIPYPSKDKSLAFNGVCRPVFSKIAKNIEQIKTIEKLRDVLLPKLMSGEVRVAHA